jgi:uncharacterized SAM-binding protein YcdF (DUF218 family)
MAGYSALVQPSSSPRFIWPFGNGGLLPSPFDLSLAMALMTNSIFPSASKIILELGGSPNRLKKAAEIYHQFPDAIVLISSEDSAHLCLNILAEANVPESKVFFNYDAWDTVTNFTETYKLITKANAQQLFVVTDKFHMERAMAIANVVYFASSIKLTPCEYLGGDLNRQESSGLIRADFLRALCWKLFGFLFYDKKVKQERMPGILTAKAEAEFIAQVV